MLGALSGQTSSPSGSKVVFPYVRCCFSVVGWLFCMNRWWILSPKTGSWLDEDWLHILLLLFACVGFTAFHLSFSWSLCFWFVIVQLRLWQLLSSCLDGRNLGTTPGCFQSALYLVGSTYSRLSWQPSIGTKADDNTYEDGLLPRMDLVLRSRRGASSDVVLVVRLESSWSGLTRFMLIRPHSRIKRCIRKQKLLVLIPWFARGNQKNTCVRVGILMTAVMKWRSNLDLSKCQVMRQALEKNHSGWTVDVETCSVVRLWRSRWPFALFRKVAMFFQNQSIFAETCGETGTPQVSEKIWSLWSSSVQLSWWFQSMKGAMILSFWHDLLQDGPLKTAINGVK